MNLRLIQLALVLLFLQGCAQCTRYEDKWVNVSTCRVYAGGYCQSMEYHMEKQQICVEWAKEPESSQSSGSETSSTQSFINEKICKNADSSLDANYKTLANAYKNFQKSPSEASAFVVLLNSASVNSNISDMYKYCAKNQYDADTLMTIKSIIGSYNSDVMKWRKNNKK